MRDKQGKFLPIITKRKYGYLTVIDYDHKEGNNQYYYKCKCDCGKEIVIRKTLLTTGKQQSCGCITKGTKRKENKYETAGIITYIYLNNGETAIIDTCEKDLVSKHYWIKKGRYVQTQTNGRKYLHNLIMKDKNIDHINRNTLDNRKDNLRKCTHQQNCINRSKRKDNKTGITGVQFRNGKWIALLTYKGQRFEKTFKDKNEAIKYRKELENKYFKEYKPM